MKIETVNFVFLTFIKETKIKKYKIVQTIENIIGFGVNLDLFNELKKLLS